MLGWYFSYSMGEIYVHFFGGGTAWINATALVGTIFSIPLWLCLFFAAIGRGKWYLWLVASLTPFIWLILITGDNARTWWFTLAVFIIPAAIGWGIRQILIKNPRFSRFLRA
jgi:hypothetical protein